MKKLLLLLLLLVGYQGYTQTVLSFYPPVKNSIEWTQEEIIQILKKGKISFCKIDELTEKNNTMFYVKNMEFNTSKDSIFDSAYLESSVFFSKKKKNQKRIHCVYFVIDGKLGGQLEISEKDFVNYPFLSKYLDKKLRKTRLKKYKE